MQGNKTHFANKAKHVLWNMALYALFTVRFMNFTMAPLSDHNVSRPIF